MEDLLAHFAGVDSDDLHHRSVSMSAEGAATPGSQPVTATTTNNGFEELLTTPPPLPVSMSSFSREADADIESLRGVFQCQNGVLNAKSSTSVDEESESGYIHHFKSGSPTPQDSVATEQSKRDLLNDLTTCNGDLDAADQGSSAHLGPALSDSCQGGLRFGDLGPSNENSDILGEHYQELELQEHYSALQDQKAASTSNAYQTNGISHLNDTSSDYGKHALPNFDINKGNNLTELLRKWHQHDVERDAILAVSLD